MALGKQKEQQQEFWVPTDVLAKSPGHPFYAKLNELLKAGKFDAYVESLCSEFYKDGGRPGIPPGVYFSHALDWLLRRYRFRTWHRLALRRLAFAA